MAEDRFNTTSTSAGPNPTNTTSNETVSGYAPGDDLAQSKYDFRSLVFPENLGMDDNGHYMVININVPTSGIPKVRNGLALGAPAGNYTNYFTPLNQVSKLDTLRYGGQGLGGGNRPAISVPRQTRRIAESIALYMPTPLIYNTNNIYEEISLTAIAGKVGIGAVTFASNALSTILGPITGSNSSLTAALENAGRRIESLGSTIGTVSSIMQNPINPAVEILFSNVAQRQFTFELLLAPRNERESIAIKSIVKTLRFHGAPEINTGIGGGGLGFTWIPPADFDITFFNKGVENLNILRINTCVLERCEVDYAPASGIYSTFRNGHPVAVRLSLGFRELEPLHKQRILQGF